MTNDQPAICPVPHRRNPERPRRCAEGFAVCGGCRDSAKEAVEELPSLWRRLETVLGQQGGGLGAGPVTGSSSEPLPINPAVMHHRQAIEATLVSWCRVVHHEYGVALPPNGSVATTCAWLKRYLDWACRQGWADELVPGLLGLRGRARALLDPALRVDILLKDGCPHEDCGGSLWGTFREFDDAPWLIVCDTTEGHEWPTETWMNLGHRILAMREREAS